MAKPRFYAVRRGREKGIFSSWEECKNQVVGFAGAEYKSFSSINDAQDYLDQTFSGEERPKKKKMSKEEKIEYYKNVAEKLSNEIPKGKMIAYVDGSFDKEKNRYSCGCVMITQGDVSVFSDFGMRPEAVPSRNVAGELTAAMYAVKAAAEKGIRDVTIYHDYSGIAKWYKKEWKAQSFAPRAILNLWKNTALIWRYLS